MSLLAIDVSGHDPIHMFEISVSGYSSREVIFNLLEKIWNCNRWRGRFYYGIRQLGYRYVVEISKVQKKDEILKSDLIRQITKHLPKAKNKQIIVA